VQAQTTFKNPVITGMNPDPSICHVGDDFYLVTSTFEYFPGLPVYHSRDLVNWNRIGYALTTASQDPLMGCSSGTGGQYAPTIRYHDNMFYVVCTNYGGQGSQGVYYVTAKNPAGPWSDPHWVNNWYVDPSLMFENDSTYFLSPDNNGSFLLGTINTETGKFIKPLKKIAEGLGGASPEGPHMYKINDYYYLMSAEGGTGYDHREVIQKSMSPWGPFEPSPINPVVSHRNDPNNPFQAIGHADLVQLPDSSWWLVCLGIRPKGGNFHHLGRETFLAPVAWNADGWPKVGSAGIVEEEMTVPNLPEFIWPEEPVRDDFDSTTLRLAWNFVRNPHAADWSLSANPGFLRLNGSKISFKEKDSPAFIGRRQTAFNVVASIMIDFTAKATNEEAGLVVRGDDVNHFDFLITMLGGKRVLMLRKYLQDKTTSLNYKELPDTDNVILRISATDLQYKFWVQEEGKTAELIGTSSTIDLSTEKIGGFTGTYIGMYASGNGSANTHPADFDWFDYEENPSLPFEWASGTQELQNSMETPVIDTTFSTAYDQARIVWKNISYETGFVIERLVENKFESIGETISNDTVFNDSGLEGNTLYSYRILGKNDKGYSAASVSTSVFTLPKPGPFSGTPAQIPGKIEAENYDYGKNGDAFYDTDAGNNAGKYRTDDVEIETCWDTDNGYDIGWINNGEWLLYTVDVNDTIADIELRIASNSGGRIKLELDGNVIAQTDIAVTGGWQTWKTLTLKNVKLETGKNKKLKISFVSGGFNFNWINFIKLKQTAIKDIKGHAISVYPNPASNMLYIKSGTFKYSNIEIFNLEGKCLFSKVTGYKPENNIQFSLPVGQYILSLNNASQKRIVKFSVIQ
jgi:alpha-N-arabinofuranosidase